MKQVTLIEPYYGGSHRAWADGFMQHSTHHIELLTLPAQFWKWRMQGGAVTMARMFLQQNVQPDAIIASDMMDLSLFRSLLRHQLTNIPIALYFHENQLTYPQNERQNHGWQYGFINYASAMSADHIFFNSAFHLEAFFEELPRMLKHFPDHNELATISELRKRASVLPLAMDLKRLDTFYVKKDPDLPPLILWNHRWEPDKNPQDFLNALKILKDDGVHFRLALAGENFRQKPAEFEEIQKLFGEDLIQYGYINDFEEYARLLWQTDYIVSTAYQDFFGISVAEAIYCGSIPILANRLNYPYLIPQEFHPDCLFEDGKLAGLLKYHLTGRVQPLSTAPLQEYISQHDWTVLRTRYDAAIDHLQICSPLS